MAYLFKSKFDNTIEQYSVGHEFTKSQLSSIVRTLA